MKKNETKMIDPRDTKVYIRIKKAYLKALEEKQEKFKVGDAEFLTSFAKYFIEHVENIRKQLGLSIYKPKK